MRRTVIAAGDAVPPDTPLGNVIERIDQPSQQKGRVLRHRQGSDQPEMRGGLGEVWNEDGRVELRRRRGIAQVGVVRTLVGVKAPSRNPR